MAYAVLSVLFLHRSYAVLAATSAVVKEVAAAAVHAVAVNVAAAVDVVAAAAAVNVVAAAVAVNLHSRSETTAFATAAAFTMANTTKGPSLSLPLPWFLPLLLLLFCCRQCLKGGKHASAAVSHC